MLAQKLSPIETLKLTSRAMILHNEIAALAVYLGSYESRGMTGQSILLDGGMVLV